MVSVCKKCAQHKVFPLYKGFFSFCYDLVYEKLSTMKGDEVYKTLLYNCTKLLVCTLCDVRLLPCYMDRHAKREHCLMPRTMCTWCLSWLGDFPEGYEHRVVCLKERYNFKNAISNEQDYLKRQEDTLKILEEHTRVIESFIGKLHARLCDFERTMRNNSDEIVFSQAKFHLNQFWQLEKASILYHLKFLQNVVDSKIFKRK